MWSRRQLLAALGASGAGVALGGWLGACGGSAQRAGAGQLGLAQTDDLLPQILQILDGKVEGAFVWSRRHQRHRISKDSEEDQFDLVGSDALVFGGSAGSVALRNLNRPELLAAAQRFAAQGSPPSAGASSPARQAAFSLPSSQSFLAKVKLDPARQSKSAMQAPVADLLKRAQSGGGSRIIYRNSYLLADDVETRFLTREHNQRRRELRLRLGVLFAAWTGEDVVTAVAERAGSGGLEMAGPSDIDLQARAHDVLAYAHARSAPSGTQDVILSPECAALVTLESIAKPAFASGLRATPQGPLRVHDDPTLAGGYGSYVRDDLGQAPTPRALFGSAEAKSMHLGNMRRDLDLALLPRPSNLLVELGEASEEDLVAEVMQGVYLEGPLHCSVNVQGSQLALLCGRGREILNGRFTGRLFGGILANAESSAFFDATRAVGNRSQTLAFEELGLPLSVQSPAWLSRAKVAASNA